MTAKKKLEEIVYNNGVFEEDANAIVELAISDIDKAEDNKYKMTWNSRADDYPDALYEVIYSMFVKPAALRYIDENKPKAWYRQCFV